MAQDLTVNELLMMDSSTLAYLGDSVYELQVRSRLVLSGKRQADELVKASLSFVTASAQSYFLDQLSGSFLYDEISIITRGRNMKHKSGRRNVSRLEYSKATAFECLFGYLYLKGRYERIDELMDLIFSIRKDGQ